MWWPRPSIRWALCASALLHFALVIALSEVAPPPARRAPRPPAPLLVEFQPLVPGASVGVEEQPATTPPVFEPGGLPLLGAVDREEPEGRGGELRAPDPGALLFPFLSPLTLQDTELNNLAVNQAQRIRTASEHRTLEQRRATPNAADAVLLASGKRGHEERREPSKQDAVTGAPQPSTPSRPGADIPGAAPALPARGELGGSAVPDPSAPSQPDMSATRAAPQAPERDAQAAELGQKAARLKPARGIARGQGRRETSAARVTFARPNVDRGPAATPAERLDPGIRDDRDAELLAAKLQRAFVDTSVQRALETGAGSGGSALHANALGELGHGRGAHARPYLPGSGEFGALDTSDARYLRWFMQQRARVQRELVFPRTRALAKDQGTSVYSIVLGRDGGLSGAPRLVRSSGFADFDAAAALAIERALPFAPLPDDLAPELDRIALLIPIAFSNPMVE